MVSTLSNTSKRFHVQAVMKYGSAISCCIARRFRFSARFEAIGHGQRRHTTSTVVTNPLYIVPPFWTNDEDNEPYGPFKTWCENVVFHLAQRSCCAASLRLFYWRGEWVSLQHLSGRVSFRLSLHRCPALFL